jgi:hypothetical protein
MSPKQRFNLFLEGEQIDALKAIQEATGATPSEQIRRAINRWIDENQPRLGSKPEADARRRVPRGRDKSR